MIKVSELLSKRLIALSDARIVGTISNIIFNNKLTQGKALKIYNDDGTGAETAYVELRKVKNLENDAAVVSDLLSVQNEWNTNTDGLLNPINSECFNQDGKSLGFVRDIVLDNLAVKAIIVDKKEFLPAQVLSFSDKLLILNDTGKPIKISKPRIEIPKTAPKTIEVKLHAAKPAITFEQEKFSAGQSDGSVNQRNERTFNAATGQQATVNIVPSDIRLPHRVPPSGTVISTPSSSEGAQTPYRFLIGKTLLKEIRSDDGKIIAEEKTAITTKTIDDARNAGKLVQLALHAE